jgi:hypothetical protein
VRVTPSDAIHYGSGAACTGDAAMSADGSAW